MDRRATIFLYSLVGAPFPYFSAWAPAQQEISLTMAEVFRSLISADSLLLKKLERNLMEQLRAANTDGFFGGTIPTARRQEIWAANEEIWKDLLANAVLF